MQREHYIAQIQKAFETHKVVALLGPQAVWKNNARQ